MNNISAAQAAYLSGLKRHRQRVRGFRLLIFILLVILWELAARTGVLDDFILLGRQSGIMVSVSGDGNWNNHLRALPNKKTLFREES